MKLTSTQPLRLYVLTVTRVLSVNEEENRRVIKNLIIIEKKRQQRALWATCSRVYN